MGVGAAGAGGDPGPVVRPAQGGPVHLSRYPDLLAPLGDDRPGYVVRSAAVGGQPPLRPADPRLSALPGGLPARVRRSPAPGPARPGGARHGERLDGLSPDRPRRAAAPRVAGLD